MIEDAYGTCETSGQLIWVSPIFQPAICLLIEHLGPTVVVQMDMYLCHQSQRDALVKGLHVHNVLRQAFAVTGRCIPNDIQRVGACVLPAEVCRLHNSQTLARISQLETAEHVEHF